MALKSGSRFPGNGSAYQGSLIFPSLASIEVTAKTLYTFSTCLKLQLARLTAIEVWILFQALWANQFSALNALSVEIKVYAFFLRAYISIIDINRLGTVDRNDTNETFVFSSNKFI